MGGVEGQLRLPQIHSVRRPVGYTTIPGFPLKDKNNDGKIHKVTEEAGPGKDPYSKATMVEFIFLPRGVNIQCHLVLT